jgi:hypothetical protein
MSDAYLRQQRGAKRRRARPASEPELELETKRAPLITQGARSSSAPLGRPATPDSLIRSGRRTALRTPRTRGIRRRSGPLAGTPTRRPPSLLRDLFSCASFLPENPGHFNLSEFCYREIDAMMKKAVDAQASDPVRANERAAPWRAWWRPSVGTSRSSRLRLVDPHFQPGTRPACSIHLCISGPCASSRVVSLM